MGRSFQLSVTLEPHQLQHLLQLLRRRFRYLAGHPGVH